MSRMGGVSLEDLKRLKSELGKLETTNDEFAVSCAKELAAKLLRKVIKRTPVGDYCKEVVVTANRDSKNHNKGDVYRKKVNIGGKTGDTLRKGWTGGEKSSAQNYAESLPVHHLGDTYIIDITNPVEYAPYVEYGHRTADHKKWVKGQFMMTISEQELERIAPKVLESKIEKYLRGCMRS